MAEIDLGKIGYPLKNDAITETPGEFALDAAMAKELMDEIDAINTRLTKVYIYDLNESQGVFVAHTNEVKRLSISNNFGVNSATNISYGFLPENLRPFRDFTKWVNARGNVTASLSIKSGTGEVTLSNVTGTVSSGTWISISESYV